MNKAQLVESVAKRTNTTKSQSESVIDAALEVIQASVSNGDDVKLVGFGTFSKFTRQARNGRNPKTGEPVRIPTSIVPKFKPGKDFKERVHDGKSIPSE